MDTRAFMDFENPSLLCSLFAAWTVPPPAFLTTCVSLRFTFTPYGLLSAFENGQIPLVTPPEHDTYSITVLYIIFCTQLLPALTSDEFANHQFGINLAIWPKITKFA